MSNEFCVSDDSGFELALDEWSSAPTSGVSPDGLGAVAGRPGGESTSRGRFAGLAFEELAASCPEELCCTNADVGVSAMPPLTSGVAELRAAGCMNHPRASVKMTQHTAGDER